MANFKRWKSRRRVRCTLCTPHRWKGNAKTRWKWWKEESVSALVLLALAVLTACSAPIHVIAPGSGVVFSCPEAVPKPTWAGPGFVGPGDVSIALKDGTHYQIADAWAIGREDWRVLNGYRVEVEKAFAECRTVVDEVNRLNRRRSVR